MKNYTTIPKTIVSYWSNGTIPKTMELGKTMEKAMVLSQELWDE